MQLSQPEIQIFEAIARQQPRFKLWLEAQVGKQHEILSKAADDVQIRRAQGNVAALQQIIDNLDYTLTSR
jgi:hypothetical protein